MLNDWKRLALLVAFLPTLVSCTPHYLVRSEYVVSQQLNTSPEIIETASYNELLPTITTIAIRAPDSCANETTAIHSGEASGRGLLLKTDCGVEMSELERALAKAGYHVISWDIIKNRVIHDENMTPVKAAKDLGAQVLFQVNSLERSAANVRQDARWERHRRTGRHRPGDLVLRVDAQRGAERSLRDRCATRLQTRELLAAVS